MATKTGNPRPGGPKSTPRAAARAPKARTADRTNARRQPAGASPNKTVNESAAKIASGDGAEKPGGSFLTSTLLPSAGCGVLLALVAVQEGADLAVGVLMAVCMTGVIAGMIKLKKAMYGG